MSTDTDPSPDLHQEVRDLRQEVEELRELRPLVDALHKRIDHLESDDTDHSGGSGGVDHRDAAVLERLSPGQDVNLQDLQQLYLTQTDVRSESTAGKRIKALTRRPEFKDMGRWKWQYIGDEDE